MTTLKTPPSKKPYPRLRLDFVNSLSELEIKLLSHELRVLLQEDTLSFKEDCYHQMFFDTRNYDFFKKGFCLRARKSFAVSPYSLALIKQGTEYDFEHYHGPKIFEEEVYFQPDKRLFVTNKNFNIQMQKVTEEPVFLVGSMSFERIEIDVPFAYVKLDRCILSSGKIYCEIKLSVKPSKEAVAEEFFKQKIKRFFDLIPDLRPMTKYERFYADLVNT